MRFRLYKTLNLELHSPIIQVFADRENQKGAQSGKRSFKDFAKRDGILLIVFIRIFEGCAIQNHFTDQFTTLLFNYTRPNPV